MPSLHPTWCYLMGLVGRCASIYLLCDQMFGRTQRETTTTDKLKDAFAFLVQSPAEASAVSQVTFVQLFSVNICITFAHCLQVANAQLKMFTGTMTSFFFGD